ncbi:LAS superfamily LD-carboxypeptidase LdcB [Paraburkholderia sp. BL6665CI2N2]|uniref:M15 family metallopeptidase n=1 Tax=Paraburkholderia sp. BL6665CI2N2 TaxID=1938806 RepID=UPI001066FC1A|nr:M15 family metallopeptidase [Paraburkholderia sp. BL6665CI2N2]TDY21990.1 LAS superfamily LD-carboxypeptidase LdcB [Paraburkholderia sp. BL6665CI2N2]
MSRTLDERELTGRTRTHVVQFSEPRFAVQPEVGKAFLAMRADARRAGIDLLPYSSFRDFHAQLRIWNGKFSGKKPLYDIDGRPRDFGSLSPSEIIDCILNWSALPGGSRHQWGTEIDVVDGATMPEGYVVKLLPEEVTSDGVFARLHGWLDDNAYGYGFFRPYKVYKGGMYPEPWHLSYGALSMPAMRQVTPELLTEVVRRSSILGKELILERIQCVYQNHILNISLPVEQW